MKILLTLTFTLLTTGCLNFKPVKIESYSAFTNAPKTTKDCSKASQTSMCNPRAYANTVADAYKNKLNKLYRQNNRHDSYLLNLVTLGVGAGLANAHVDVVESAALGIGYVTAQKNYNSVAFQLEVYTNAMFAAQCVHSKSWRLDEGHGQLEKISTNIALIEESLSFLKEKSADTETYIENKAKYLISFESLSKKLNTTIAQAKITQSKLEDAPSLITDTIQLIEKKVYNLFRGNLPNIASITAQLEQGIRERLTIENMEPPVAISAEQAKRTFNELDVKNNPSDFSISKQVLKALMANKALTDLPLVKYATDSIDVSACSASL